MSRELLLIRHGELPDEYQGRFVGANDPGLSATGRKQGEALAKPLLEFAPEVIFSSPLKRALETLEMAGVAMDNVKCDNRLLEMDFGDWTNLTFAEIEQKNRPDLLQIWAQNPLAMVFPGGDSVSDFAARVDDFFGKLPQTKFKRVAVMTHGGVIMRFLCDLLDYPMEKQFELLPPRGGWQILTWNEEGKLQKREKFY